ncbi:hypothetical protein [Nitrospirillum viridazoti]|uniref:hypothetical protein n=1 Tax=Nitrospirillum viridazoti TaxID=3144925 RepID=UPI0011A8568B|nr:hypothetical protein [Nitrospirillum amazonense]TWB34206.1 hypothetical protein FBZ91_112102 [Nitrospirillum amazonense]
MGRHRGLLSRLAPGFRQGGEALATESLRIILEAHQSVRTRFINILQEVGLDKKFSHAVFRSEYCVKGVGRIDVVAKTSAEELALVLEAKFPSAPLRENQITEYSKKVAAGGVLLYVVPRARMRVMIDLIKEKLGILSSIQTGSIAGLIILRKADESTSGVAIINWDTLLSEIGRVDNADIANDVEQLRSHCNDMELVEFEEIRANTLIDKSLAKEFAQILRLSDLIFQKSMEHFGLKKVRTYDEMPFVGWYFDGVPWAGWFGFDPVAWAQHGWSPLWLNIPLGKNINLLTNKAKDNWISAGGRQDIILHYYNDYWGIPVDIITIPDQEAIIGYALKCIRGVHEAYMAVSNESA